MTNASSRVGSAAESKIYVVRDAVPGASPRAEYPYTLRGVQDALERAMFASQHRGIPQEVAVVGGGEDRVIRRYEDGREVWFRRARP